ncbi:pyridoxamine 5'-phosphate oxidase [Bacillus oleivorans]|uniref:Pyridoxamine 5'-phosphate oxidase n=1 Tax=Bacillus oleivorans TaxID=1448271 RepID=A0A285D4T5_9BACI|nr:pyridoxal 5'-phosphate synthase [Bacillus oleivorans]SNX74827.1 pyridoxamine 5'-phosphate oxidase [Bacillus oleivorans]
MSDIKELLRNIKTLAGPLPEFEIHHAPQKPHPLFIKWIKEALDAEVSEPHAMTLSTVDSNGYPDARVLILKNIDEKGWYFATSSDSRKGQQLMNNPEVALTFYWPKLGRQIRIRGTAIHTGENASSKDFLERGKIARAIAMTCKQSEVLPDPAEIEAEIQKQLEQMNEEPNLAYNRWTLYCVEAKEVEFWQGNSDRKHIRLQYRLEDINWSQEQLWP